MTGMSCRPKSSSDPAGRQGCHVQPGFAGFAESCNQLRDAPQLRSMRHGPPHTPPPIRPPHAHHQRSTWLVVRNALGEVVDVTALEPQTDLRTILTGCQGRTGCVGWDCEEIGRACASFFCSRDGSRELVAIERTQSPPIGERW